MCTSVFQVEVVIPTQTKYIDLIGSIGERLAAELENFTGDREALAYYLNLVLTEATANAIKHGNFNNPRDTVKIAIHIHQEALIIHVYDHGQGFDLETVPTPDFDQPQESGMGLFFIKTLMDKVSYKRQGDTNVLEIIKYLQ
jgi:serine/threonine-protein kinase RsbW